MKYISNAFSTKMLNPNTHPVMHMTRTNYEEIQENKKELISSIGHQNIADHIGIKKERMNIQLEKGDTLYLVQNLYDEDNEEIYDYKKILIK